MKKCNLWCVRAGSGRYTESFIKGNYFAIGWNTLGDLSKIKTRDELYPLYEQANPKDGKVVTGQQVGQIARFLLEIQSSDYIITPSPDTEKLLYGQVETGIYYYHPGDDSCPYQHRRPIKWNNKEYNRGDFSVPFQNTIRSSLTVFSISQSDEFFKVIDRTDLISEIAKKQEQYDSYNIVLKQILQLNDKEFEILVSHLLTALDFEGTEVTGRSHDGGVDVTGELNVSNLAKIKVFVQAKRYKLTSKIDANIVKKLRSSIPRDGQGIFITTAKYQEKARQVALDPDFPRIGLINGHQLVDLLIEHWNHIPTEFQEKLGLQPGLVVV